MARERGKGKLRHHMALGTLTFLVLVITVAARSRKSPDRFGSDTESVFFKPSKKIELAPTIFNEYGERTSPLTISTAELEQRQAERRRRQKLDEDTGKGMGRRDGIHGDNPSPRTPPPPSPPAAPPSPVGRRREDSAEAAAAKFMEALAILESGKATGRAGRAATMDNEWRPASSHRSRSHGL